MFRSVSVNYANEKLHQQFLQFMFKVEQAAYEEEGVQWEHIEFTDNASTVELIDQKVGGVFALLNEECR